jgi:hypothetical protein
MGEGKRLSCALSVSSVSGFFPKGQEFFTFSQIVANKNVSRCCQVTPVGKVAPI